MSTTSDWIWMPHPAHFIVSDYCRFKLATYLPSGYIVSTVGEYWPERRVREIHAETHDLAWHMANKHLLGDGYDRAYMKHFGYEQIGVDRLYETMVFRAAKTKEEEKCQACPYKIIVAGGELDYMAYNDPAEAFNGHYKLCKEWELEK